MYIESSAPRKPGQKAWLVSRQIGFTQPQCVSFYYNMYGDHIGSLNVYVKTGAQLPSTPVWSLSGNQGQQWLLGQATVQGNQPYRVCSTLFVFIFLVSCIQHQTLAQIQNAALPLVILSFLLKISQSRALLLRFAY